MGDGKKNPETDKQKIIVYEVTVSKSALKQLEKLPADYKETIIAKIDSLAKNPRPHGCEKLSGTKNNYRIRAGMYRIVYSVFDKELVIDVVDVDHRKQVYRNL